MNLLVCDKDGFFEVCPTAAGVFEAWEQAFHVGSFIGVERQGKSTFASWLSQYTVFPSMSGTEGFTKAVWCAHKPNDCHVWYLDFEGFGHNCKHNTALFVLAVLLSQVVLFNSPKTIRLEDLDKLQGVGCLSKNLMAGMPRPALLWLLRDFDLNEKDNQYDYLLQCMNENPSIKTDILTLFPDLKCLRVPHPHGSVPRGAPPPKMQPAVQTVKHTLEGVLEHRQKTTGAEFVALLRAVCKVVNGAGETMDVGNLWQVKQDADKRVRHWQRQMEISDICRNQLKNMSPAKFEHTLQTLFSAAERAEYDELFCRERETNEVQWTERTTLVKDKISAGLEKCVSVKDLAVLLQKVVKLQPREVVDYAFVQLLPHLALKLAAAAELEEQQARDFELETKTLKERTASLEQTITDRIEQTRAAREQLTQLLTEQHTKELQLKEQELLQEKTRAQLVEQQTREQAEELSRVMTDWHDVKLQLEEEAAEKAELSRLMSLEQQQTAGLKRKLHDVETTCEQTCKKQKEDYSQQVVELKAAHDKLSDRVLLFQEQLEQATHEIEVQTRRAQELESSRNKLHGEALNLRDKLFTQQPAVDSTELSLRAQMKALQEQNKRLLQYKLKSSH
jgi:hypothetical protein